MRRVASPGHFVVRIPRSSIYLAFAGVALMSIYWVASSASASTVTYTPSSCTGDWHEPGLAVDTSPDSLFSFRDAEAAVTMQTGQTLFCAFGGVTADGVRAIKTAELVLHFVPATYLATEDSDALAVVSDATTAMATTSTTSGAHASSTSDQDVSSDDATQATTTHALALPGATDTGVQIHATATEPEIAISEAAAGTPMVPEPPTADVPTPADEASSEHDGVVVVEGEESPSPVISTDPASQETSGTETHEAAPAPQEPAESPLPPSSAPESDPISSLLFRALGGASVAHAEESTSTDAAIEPPADLPVADATSADTAIVVSYTTDATGWKELGSVSGGDIARTVRIPLALSTASDIESLVVRLRGDAIGAAAYLDGMSLEVEYEDEDATLSARQDAESSLARTVSQEDHAVSVLPINDATVFAILEADARVGLYKITEDGAGRVISEIAGAAMTASTTLSLMEGWVFWVAEEDLLHAYDAYSGSRHTARLVYDELEGDTIALIPAFPMTIVWREGAMYFWTPEGTEEEPDAVSLAPSFELASELEQFSPPLPAREPVTAPSETTRPAPTHVCSVEPFSLRIEESGMLSVRFTKSELIRATARIGVMPTGLTARFRESGADVLELPEWTTLTRETAIDIEADEPGRGDYTVPIVFTQHGPYDAETVCQFNVIR